MRDGGGLELGESFAQAVRVTTGSYPHDAGRSRGHRIGGQVPAEAHSSRVHGSAPPLPRSRLHASRWRSGRVSRCSAYCTQGQPGTSSTEGDKSEEAVPVLWLTFNIRHPENPQLIRPTGVFALYNSESIFKLCRYFSIATSENRSSCKSARNGGLRRV